LLNFLAQKSDNLPKSSSFVARNIYKQQFYMTFPYQRLAILGILWSVATVASCGQAVAGVHNKHFTTTNFQTPLFLQTTSPLNKGWAVFKDTLGAFSIELPNYPTCKSLNNSFLSPYEYDVVGLKMHLFKSIDAEGNTLSLIHI
jgi:hypothetical protein